MELVVQSGPDTGKTFQVGANPLVAGRQSTADIVLNDNQISRRHAQFELVNGTLVVSDLGSANGTRFNGNVLSANTPQPMRPGDRVQLGDTVLVARAPNVVVPPQPQYTQPAAPLPPQYNQPPAGQFAPQQQFAPQNFNAPVPPQNFGAPNVAPQGFNPPPSPPQNFNAPNAAPQNFNAPAPPATTYKPKKSGVPVVGLALLGIVVLAIVGGIIFFISNGSTPNNPVPSANTPIAGGTTAPVVPPTVAAGVSGSNNAPAPPPANAPTAAAGPTPTSQPVQNTGSGQVARGIGLQITFPNGWEIFNDANRNLIEGSAPDDVTYVQIQKLSGLQGTGSERLQEYLDNVQQVQSDMKIVQDIRPLSTGGGAQAYISYTDKQDKLLHRDYVVVIPDDDETYVLRCSTEDAKFNGQVNTFNQILSSIKVE
jgi:predicted component of type VI protein secretion system